MRRRCGLRKCKSRFFTFQSWHDPSCCVTVCVTTVRFTRATLLKEWKCFAGVVKQFRHASSATKTDMTFTIYLPPQALAGSRVPVRGAVLRKQDRK